VPVLQACTTGARDFDLETLGPALVQHALTCGLGPLLAHVGGQRPKAPTSASHADAVRAADLTARVLTAAKYDVVRDVLAGAAALDGCRVALLKGIATACRYYPAPHLRTSGDIDLLVTPGGQPALESLLRELGFRQRSAQAPATFVGRHHSMPFWHPDRDVWIDVHTRVHPPEYPLGRDPRFDPAALWPRLVPCDIAGGTA
jgi:hypothetical protein